ncbi:MAG: SDR family NAD(P)-dependent oxidoreductase [Bacteroidota bacterium]
MIGLNGKVAIVTGGAKGIGVGICDVFCRAGARVIIWDILDQGEQTAAELSQKGYKISFMKVDITSAEETAAACARIVDEHGKIDIMVNNAGVIRDRSFQKMSPEEWNLVVNVNINSLYTTTKAVLPHMKENGYGRIIFASSINAMTGAFGQTNYCASKAAIQGFTRALCKEVGKYGITVNCVAPGFIKSDMTDSMPDHVVEAGIKMIPVGRIGTAEDMGYAYLFLASQEAAYISGITLHANGGAYAI